MSYLQQLKRQAQALQTRQGGQQQGIEADTVSRTLPATTVNRMALEARARLIVGESRCFL